MGFRSFPDGPLVAPPFLLLRRLTSGLWGARDKGCSLFFFARGREGGAFRLFWVSPTTIITISPPLVHEGLNHATYSHDMVSRCLQCTKMSFWISNIPDFAPHIEPDSRREKKDMFYHRPPKRQPCNHKVSFLIAI